MDGDGVRSIALYWKEKKSEGTPNLYLDAPGDPRVKLCPPQRQQA